MAVNQENHMELTESQKLRIEKNRQKALEIRQSRLVAHPYSKSNAVSIEKNIIKVGSIKYKDTGGGFLLEENLEVEEPDVNIQQDEPLIVEPDRPTCETCQKKFPKSWLFDTFDCKICDECKDPEMHKLITKTDAKNEYLLKDVDLEKRDPPLKYITRKNPHNSRWGDMKLYLQIQVEERALEVWGSEEKIEDELEQREEKRVIAKGKKYQKQMKELRMAMRSSLYDKTAGASHIHQFGDETYNEEDDTYTHTCITCEYVETFEKM